VDVAYNSTVRTFLPDDEFRKLTFSTSTTLQGLLLFARHDATLLVVIEETGIFDTMFSTIAKEAAYIILANAERVAAFHHTYDQDKQLLTGEQLYLRSIIKSLDVAIELSRTACTREAFLTAIALSIKIFLETVLRCTTNSGEDFGNSAVQLMEVLQKPGQQLHSSLALCSVLETTFWQAMMGAIAAPDAQTKLFYTSRLRRITIALALTTWHDASVILQRFFWIPSIFSPPGYQILSEILHSQGCNDI
jgi:hypothetical protein